MRLFRRVTFILLVAALVLGVGFLVVRRLNAGEEESSSRDGPTAVPVRIVAVERGDIEDRRMFSGSLEATARTTLAPKIAGRITSLTLDIGDTVERGSVAAVLDSAEFVQEVAQSEADLAVARAELVEAESAAAIAQRALDRVTTLYDRGVASESQLDETRADHLAKSAAIQVATARVMRAEAATASAKIRLGYATIRADWEGGDDTRVVAERFVEPGDTVSANTPLLSIIELDPIEAVIFATERDYGLLAADQRVTVTTDAYPGRTWEGRVSRISPVFREGSRQARVEVRAANPDGALKPGMFVRVEAVLGRATDAVLVPVEALAERAGRTVVFVVGDDRSTARLVEVRVGIMQGGLVQVLGDGVEGHVVTLGQQLLDEETAISIPEGPAEDGGGGA